MSTITATHIELDERGVAWIANTKVKVIEVAVDKIVHGSSPEEMHYQYPHLSLAQIHAALSYYYDHQTELDADIRRRWAEGDELAASSSDSTLRRKFLALKSAQAGVGIAQRSYRRKKGHDTWHWCRNCSTWPASDYEERAVSDEFAGELCNECHAKEKSSRCHP
jgi:uncharacterized protein (DUF433 family)